MSLPYVAFNAGEPQVAVHTSLGGEDWKIPLVALAPPGPGGGGGSVVVIEPSRGVLADHSGTITAANVSQSAVPANLDRKYIFIQNNAGPGFDLWIVFGAGPAVQDQPSILLPNKGSFVMESSFLSTEELHIIGTNIGDSFTIKEG